MGQVLVGWRSSNNNEQQRLDSPENRHLYGFILETYAYLVIVNHIAPPSLLPDRAVPYDVLACLDSLRGYGSFGILFCGYHELFALIPAIAQVAEKIEGDEDQLRVDTSLYHPLRTRIQAWRFPGSRYPEHVDMAQRLAVGEAYRQGLFIFLETAMLGSSNPTDAFKLGLQRHVGEFLSSITDSGVLESELASILLWPTVITGSVLVDEGHRETFAAGLRGSPYGTWSTIRAAELLECLWEDGSNSGLFGPYGLYKTMKKRGINPCMS